MEPSQTSWTESEAKAHQEEGVHPGIQQIVSGDPRLKERAVEEHPQVDFKHTKEGTISHILCGWKGGCGCQLPCLLWISDQICEIQNKSRAWESMPSIQEVLGSISSTS